jgi:hypothetical protein
VIGRPRSCAGSPLSSRRLVEERCNIPCSLVRRQEGDDDLARAAAFAAQSVLHSGQRERVTKLLAQLLEGQSSRMLALAAIRTVVVRVIDVHKGGGFEPGVFHLPTLRSPGCGLLLYNSNSDRSAGTLDEATVGHTDHRMRFSDDKLCYISLINY